MSWRPRVRRESKTKKVTTPADYECDVEVFSHRGGVKLLGGKWVPVQARFEGTMILMTGSSYIKTLMVTKGTTAEAMPQPGKFVLQVRGFNGGGKNKRLIDCKSQSIADEWLSRIAALAATGGGAVLSSKPRPFSSRISVLDTGKAMECEGEFRVSRRARERLWRAVAHVTKDVAEKRRRKKGYTAQELAQLNSELLELERQSRQQLKFKIRRVLRVAVAEHKARTYNAFSAHAKQHGLDLSRQKSGDALEEGVARTLPDLMAKNRVLSNLVVTLQHLSEKDKLSVEDAVTCLLVGTVMKTLLDIGGGLQILLSLPRERYAFRMLCVSALLCRVPVFTTRILELLAALALLQNEGYTMVRSVLREVDKRAKWGQAVCTSAPLLPSREARATEAPPAFAALAQLLAANENFDDVRTAVVTLFTAVCNSVHHSQDRQAALWLQVQIFHAVRCVVVVADHPTKADGGERLRRATITRRQESVQNSTDAAASLCPPLVAILDATEASASSQLLRIGLERFLDSWDARQLDEDEECENHLPGSAPRVAIFGDRIRRAALLLAHADIDAMLDVLGTELEQASAQPLKRDHNDDPPLEFDVHATVAALNRISTGAPAEASKKSTGALEAMLAAKAQKATPSTGTALKDDPKYAKYFKMLKMHIPVQAVALKMSSEGLDPSVLDMDANAPPAEDSPVVAVVAVQDDPKYAKYFKMLRMHIPKPAVAAKMTAEGVDPAILDMDPEGPAVAPKVAVVAETPKAEGVALKDDPKYAKFFKMIKMHVPKMAVAAKMAAENLDSAVLDLDPDKPAPASGQRPSVIAASKPDLKEPPKGCARAPSKKVRKVFLDLLTDGSDTWWAASNNGVVLEEPALKELEQVFVMPEKRTTLVNEDAKAAAAAAVSDMAEAAAVSSKKKKELRSIVAEATDSKRAFGLSLQFSSLKLPTATITAALGCLDFGDSPVLVSNPAQLNTLYTMLQSQEEVDKIGEIAQMTSASDHLDEVSSFFVNVTKNVKRPRQKVVFVWLRATLEERCDELCAQIEAIKSAAAAVRGAESLKTILKTTLAVSNFLNHGNPRSKVAGVKVGSLAKLRQTKCTVTDNYKTLLTFVVSHAKVDPKVLRSELPEDLISTVYANPPRADLKSSVAELRVEQRAAEKECSALQHDASNVVSEASAFVAKADRDIAQLEKLYKEMDDAVDEMLVHYGEPPTTDLEDWLKDVDRFVAQYDVEHREIADALARKRKRQELADNREQREARMQTLNNAALKTPTGRPKTGRFSRVIVGIQTGGALEEGPSKATTPKRTGAANPTRNLKAHADDWAKRLRVAFRQDSIREDDNDDNDFDD